MARRKFLTSIERKFEKHLHVLKTRPFNPHISDELNLYIRDTLGQAPLDYDLKNLTWKDFSLAEIIYKCQTPGKWKAYQFLESYAKHGEKYVLTLETTRRHNRRLTVAREEQLRAKSLKSLTSKKKS